ncbi:substrate-binding domain-containing protein [Rhizobium leguminosarum]|uniref:rhamnose ABC transporter substrate-binding protein n=1 Tax=Rhizobium leguminosarum TaxID=384 RepID=UPI001441923D|nr:rhamnose ABC transporter substrate-binding protein [Rhizobium leguminosarum]MBY5904198.1 substrate-binding domain-containing protein [Rhizobium leguminosarum]MBY5911567.1 substrate-binding domain-containing protein [Rhizobium leguminosarum]NKK89187.1 substrate-binding domain-containing protein [Rhizobium leguminosarum bv. viciae]
MKCFKTIALAATAVALLASASYAQECATESVKIGWLPKLDTDPYFQVAGDGAQDAAKEIGGEIVRLAPSQATAEAQVEIVNNLVSQGVKVIALASNDANAIAPALKRAAKQGVRTITFDSDAAAEARTVFVNQAKGDSLAEMMLQSMHDLIGGEGEFAILSSTATAANQNAWIDFMKQKLSGDPKFSKMKLVQVAYGEESEQINQQQALALVQAYPNLKGIIVPAGIGLPAAARALDEAGLTGKVKLTGLAPASLMKKYVTNGSAQVIWWNVTDLGYLTYYAAQAAAQCKLTGKSGESLKAGRLGDYTVGDKGEIILGPAKIVTPDNLAEFKF